MNLNICGGGLLRTEKLPATPGFCCIDDYDDGPQACTCWFEVWDAEQQPVRPGLALPPTPLKMCSDCAYRPNSPERTGADGYAGDQDELDRLVTEGEPFFCHKGIRHAVRLRHPSGMEIDAHAGSYNPPIAPAGEGLRPVPYKADGSPADLCGGWLLLRAKAVQA